MSEYPKGPYQYVTQWQLNPDGANPFVNTTGKYIVIIGYDAAVLDPLGGGIGIYDPQGNRLEQSLSNNIASDYSTLAGPEPSGGTIVRLAANQRITSSLFRTVTLVPSKMLLAPDHVLAMTAGHGWHGLACDSLYYAALLL